MSQSVNVFDPVLVEEIKENISIVNKERCSSFNERECSDIYELKVKYTDEYSQIQDGYKTHDDG